MSAFLDAIRAAFTSGPMEPTPVAPAPVIPIATIEPIPTRLKMLDAAAAKYGLSEKANASAIIDLAHKAGQLWYNDVTTAWCGVFMTYLVMQAGLKPVDTPAHARNWLAAGTSVILPLPGDICVFSRGAPDSQDGHVTLFVRQDGNTIYCLGGNQGDQVNIEGFNAEHLLGIRRLA